MTAATIEMKKDTHTVLISPLDPNFVIDESLNTSRQGDPWTEEKLQLFAESIETYGQQQACKGYQDDEGKVHLTFGYGRAMASRIIAKRNPDWKLKITLEKHVSDDRRADANIVENYHRRKNNHMDMAIAAKQRLDAGYSKADVAKLFMCSEVLIDQVLPLNSLNKKYQDAIRDDRLLMSTALDCLKIKDKELRNKTLDTIISEAKRTGQRLTSRQARKTINAVHEAHESGTDTGEEQQNGKRTRTTLPAFPRAVPDIKEFFTNIRDSPVYPASVRGFGDTMMKWITGQLGKPDKADDLLGKALEKVFLDDPKGQKNDNDEDMSEGWTTGT